MTTYRIDLPWQRPPLSENDRMGWAKKARTVRDIRHTVGWLVKATRIPAGSHCVVTLYWEPGVKRIRDVENPTPTYKSACDGIVSAGIVKDDSPEYMEKPGCVILPVRKPGAMWLDITVTEVAS